MGKPWLPTKVDRLLCELAAKDAVVRPGYAGSVRSSRFLTLANLCYKLWLVKIESVLVVQFFKCWKLHFGGLSFILRNALDDIRGVVSSKR